MSQRFEDWDTLPELPYVHTDESTAYRMRTAHDMGEHEDHAHINCDDCMDYRE